MKSLPYVSSALFGLTIYLLLELIFGSYGFVAYRAVDHFQRTVDESHQRVADREEELFIEISRLQTDAEMIRQAAHDIGMVDPDEGVIRISGYSGTRRRSYDPGRPAPAIREIADNRPLFRGIALAVALTALIAQLMMTGRPISLQRRDRNTPD